VSGRIAGQVAIIIRRVLRDDLGLLPFLARVQPMLRCATERTWT
jgi:hypothetical protein